MDKQGLMRIPIFGITVVTFGVVLLLRQIHLISIDGYGVIEHSPYVYVPAFLIVFGLSFVMLFIFNMRDFHLLVPSVIFIGLGVAFMMTEIGYWYVGDVKEAISMYWPVALIVFGGLMLVRKKQV